MAEVLYILCPVCHKTNLRRARFCQHCGRDIMLNNDDPYSSDQRRYFITQIIKQGGQGAVYKAIDQDGKEYAIKEMLDRFSGRREHEERLEAIRRFEEEAKLLQSLNHPRIPRVYSYFEDSNPNNTGLTQNHIHRHYLAMDYIEGEDLDDVLERRRWLSEPEVLQIAEQICDVLIYLHSKGLIYRDMKPSNIMLDHRNGGIKLIDFGIAKLFDAPNRRATQIGTPGYAPPEQYQGLATVESDIYAFGATLHHMLTGRDPTDEAPFSFPSIRSLKPGITQQTIQVVEKALQMEPQARWRSVVEMRDALFADRVRLLSAPQVSGYPRPTPTTPQNRPAPAVPSPQPAQQARPVQQAQPVQQGHAAARPAAIPAPVTASNEVPAKQAKKQKKGKKRGSFLRLLFILAIAYGCYYSYVNYPEQVKAATHQVQELITKLFSSSESSIPSQTFTTELSLIESEVLSQESILEHFRAAFYEQAVSTFGSSVVVNQNAPPSLVGTITQEQLENGSIRYKATMTGLVSGMQ